MPPGPGWLSMMKRWPSRSPSLSATMRAVISALPPAPNGNTIRTGRSGNAADAGIVPSASAATQSVVIFKSVLPHIRRLLSVVVGDQLALSNKALHVFIVPQSAGPACIFDRTANAPYSRASVARTPNNHECCHESHREFHHGRHRVSE